ncbi:MAG: HEAT repeat domain-containing protein [Myxococcales bacterium]|nr:HEAT repeat domain-containing protein [Myxococcales bacterium]
MKRCILPTTLLFAGLLCACTTQQAHQKSDASPAKTAYKESPDIKIKEPPPEERAAPSASPSSVASPVGPPPSSSPALNARLSRYYATTRMVVLRYLAAAAVQKARAKGQEPRGRIRVAWPTKAALPLLVSQIRDAQRWEERWAAIRLLSELQHHAAPTIPLLLRQFQGSKQNLIKIVIADTLGRIGSSAANAQPTLRTAFSQGSNHEVRASVLRALWKIDASDTENRTIIFRGLKDHHLQVRLMAIIATAALRPFTDEINDHLVGGLRDTHWLARLTAVVSMGKLGMLASSNVPQLKALLRDPQWQVRFYTARVLPMMGPRASLARSDLQSLTTDAHPKVRAAAQKALSEIQE